MTKTQRKRTAVASMFQNGISRIPNVPKGTVFTEKVTYKHTVQSRYYETEEWT